MRIEDRKQGQPEARGLRRRCDPHGHLRRIGVGRAGEVVVQIMELPDAGEAGLQHLDIGERGDRLDLIGAQPLQEAVHDLAPSPEAVGRGAAYLSQSRHPALKGVAVKIGQARQRWAIGAFARLARRVRLNRGDLAVVDADAHLARPAGRQQRAVEPDRFTSIRHWTSLLAQTYVYTLIETM